MKRAILSTLLFCLLSPLTVFSQDWDEAEYKKIEQSIKSPQISGKDYLITKFGAKPSNTAVLNQKAIQQAFYICVIL